MSGREAIPENHRRLILACTLYSVPGKYNGVYPRPLRKRGAD